MPVLVLVLALILLIIIILTKVVITTVAPAYAKAYDPIEVGTAGRVKVEPATTGLDPKDKDRIVNVVGCRTMNVVDEDRNGDRYWRENGSVDELRNDVETSNSNEEIPQDGQ